jgi:glycosyltransferase involved in cell wall biosynthesis
MSGEYVIERLRRDHDVRSISADGDGGQRVLRLPIRALREMGFVLARPDRGRVRRMLESVDVVHLQLPFWLSFTALHAAKKLGLPVVAGFHFQPENAFHNVGIHSEWLNETVYRFLVKRFYNQVDAVICPTHFAEEKLLAYGLTTPAVVVSNGVPPDVARAMAHAEPHVAHGPDDPFFILAVGRLAAEKRQELILEAVRLSRHRDRIRLVISGAGPREAELKQLALALPNGAEIGFRPRDELLSDLVCADLFIHASDVELEGMAVLEAMSAGLPPLIADAPESAAAAFALNPDFLFPAGDALALSRKIDALIEDPAKLEAARAAYRERAHAFDFDAGVRKLVDVYRWAIERHNEPRDRAAE